MKSSRQAFRVSIPGRIGAQNVTALVRSALAASGVREGLCLVTSVHTSSAIVMTDADAALVADFDDLLAGLVPEGAGYRHDATDYKKNADGHLKCALAGLSVTVAITDGELDLGEWQTIYYLEMDGGREKEFMVKIVGE